MTIHARRVMQQREGGEALARLGKFPEKRRRASGSEYQKEERQLKSTHSEKGSSRERALRVWIEELKAKGEKNRNN